MTATLADSRIVGKRNAANADLGQCQSVGRPRIRKRKEPRTPAHALFVRRVREEMAARLLNPNSLEPYGIKQRTLADALDGTDLRLSTIYATAKALGLETWQLLQDPAVKSAGANIVHLRTPKPVFGSDDKIPIGKSSYRKKTKR